MGWQQKPANNYWQYQVFRKSKENPQVDYHFDSIAQAKTFGEMMDSVTKIVVISTQEVIYERASD